MESHISAAEAAQTFPDVIERVHTRGDVFIVERAGESMCRIAPRAACAAHGSRPRAAAPGHAASGRRAP